MTLRAQIEKHWKCLEALLGVAAMMGVVFCVAAVNAGPADDSPQLANVAPVGFTLKNVPPVDYGDGLGDRVSVLVQFAPGLRRDGGKRANVRTFFQRQGAYQKYEYGKVLPNVVNIRDIPLSQVAALRRMPGVVWVERDKMVHAYMDDSTPLIRALQSQIASAGFTADGSSVRVCIVDTGIDSDNQMYATRIDTAAGRDFVNNDNNPEDDNGHGSHVAGTAVGGTGISRTVCGVSKPFQGVAPNATLIGVKVLDAAGSGSFSNVIAGINYCADQTAGGGRADVISMSLGGGQFSGTCDSDSGAAAANNAVNAGVVVIAASGNDGFANAMGTPACGSQVIAVGATYDANFPNCANSTSSFNWGVCTDNSPTVDSIICFSNKNDFLDVVAPGCNTFSASNAAGGTSITAKCGTSMATPHVAGLAALILNADPTLTPAQVRQIIRDGAVDLGAAGFDRTFGFGRVDAINSLQLVGPGCATNADCDDLDPCTTDVCSGGSCSNTPISCPTGQTCIGGTCQGQGACCTGLTCAIDNPTNCSASGGSYLGDGTVCGSGAAGNPTVYSSAPGVVIPDGGGAGNPATDTINVPDSVTISDVNVDLTIAHTWVGDLTVTVSHLGTTVTILDRPGVPASTFGCSNNNFSGMLLDDEGTGGTIESQCVANLSSPPNYTPNNPLSAFDGLDSAGVWTITVYDSVSADGGTLDTWSLHIDAVGSNPCTGCTTNAQCDDGLFCNGAETCVGGACQAGTAVNCNDGVGCTTDSCNEATASCDNVPNNANCDDGLACNGVETCDAVLDCQAGTAVNCDDLVACTTDACNEPGGTCTNTPSNAACADGLFCNGAETCDTVLGCQVGSDPCPGQSCNEATGTCVACLVNLDCDDGVFCNGAETCVSGTCQAGTAVNCNDGVGCTNDSCNEATNSCDNVASNANCDDGLACNGAETCDAVLDCQAGTAVNCDDLVACTTDACNEPGGTCTNTPSNAACDDGLFCNGAETCDAVLGCQAGTVVNCNDAVACTDDSCNEATNSCDNIASNANCDDGLFCNGAETCDAVLDCQAGSPPCGGLGCDEATNTCTGGGCTINADCDDANACTVDTCTANVCSNACPNSVSVFPYAENFDAGLGLWTNNTTGDVFDWTRRSGTTPSSNTGPSGDHTTGTGFYMYTETSSPRVSGDTAVLEGPCLDLSGASSATFTFWYNMNGANMGTLDAEVTTDCGIWTNVFTLSGNQGNTWFQATVDLTPEVGSSTVKIRFRGTRGSSWRGDMAIDDVAVTIVQAANCTVNADCNDGNVCTDDACVGSVCQNTNNTLACNDGLFCNGSDVCQAGTCTPITNPGVANGTFDGAGSWVSNTAAGGTITYPANLNVVGTNGGAGGFTWASQSGVTVNGANLEFDLLSYSSSDTSDWDYPVFFLNGTYYGLNANGTLGAATTGGNGNGGTVDNAGQVTTTIHYVVNLDVLAGNTGPHTVGFGVHSVDGAFGAGTAVYDNVIPAGGPIDPCPGQTCDEVNNVCVP